MPLSPEHSSKTNRWFTPPWILERVRYVLDEIDFDPASEAKANKVVGAKRYLAKNGHVFKNWYGSRPESVYCNPPGGYLGTGIRTRISMPLVFWRNLVLFRSEQRLTHAIFLGFNTSILRLGQAYTPSPMECPFVIPKERIAFVNGDTGEVDPQPTKDNAIIYVPGTMDRSAAFEEAFGDLGKPCNLRRVA